MDMGNTYLRMKFRVRMSFANEEKTMRRLGTLRDERINGNFYNKLRQRLSTFRSELQAEGLL